MANTNPLPYDRRLSTRHNVKTRVKILTKNKSMFTSAINLSASGTLVKTEELALKKLETVQLTFVIIIGNIYKLHKRSAKVMHVTNGNTGFLLESVAK